MIKKIKKPSALLSALLLAFMPLLASCGDDTQVSDRRQKQVVLQINKGECEPGDDAASAAGTGNDGPSGTYKYLVLHDTEGGGTPESVATYWEGANSGAVATHFVVGKDGSVLECVPLDKIAHHAGFGSDGHNEKFGVSDEADDKVGVQAVSGLSDYGMNANSIGIEMIHSNSSDTSYPSVQLESLDKLIKYIDEKTGTKATIISHNDWRIGNSDTGEVFDANYKSNYKGENRSHDGKPVSEAYPEDKIGHHETASFQHGNLSWPGGGDGSSTDSSSGGTSGDSGSSLAGSGSSGSSSSSGTSSTATSLTKVSGMTKVKDGYKIPGDYQKDKNYRGQNWSLSDDERGKGIFTSEDGWGEEWSKTNYMVAARWEYCTYEVSPGRYPGWSVHGCTDGLVDSSIGGNLDSEQYSWTCKQKVVVFNPENNKAVVCQVGNGSDNPNWGGNPLGAVAGLSYIAQEALGFQAAGLDGGDYQGSCLDNNTEMEMWWVDENTPLGPTNIDQVATAKTEQCGEGGDKAAAGVGVEGALAWAEKAAADVTVGYSWFGTVDPEGKDRNSIEQYDGKTNVNCDCSALVFWSLVLGGGFTELRDLHPGNAFTTDDEAGVLEQIGFTRLPYSGTELKRGDILINSHHTVWVSDPDGPKFTEASGAEGGGVEGVAGDQLQIAGDGSEEVYSAHNSGGGFDVVMRKTGGSSSSSSSSSSSLDNSSGASGTS